MNTMRLARPVYESLPYVYGTIGSLAIVLFYLDPVGIAGIITFSIAFVAETAALTLFLRRRDYRALSQEYSGEIIELPSTLNG
ncbi:MAG TPA: hypothetical protein VHZ53_16100 [Steroidobacteraceae bacterium]|jgi:hypothetical protein|nr:hypothetical protein [Steroidobacteraceae bacterium]